MEDADIERLSSCEECGAIDGTAHSRDCSLAEVDHPHHYGGADNPYEAIKVIEAWDLDFCLGNAVKYIWRAGQKGDAVEDLKKARWYIDREIIRLLDSALDDDIPF